MRLKMIVGAAAIAVAAGTVVAGAALADDIPADPGSGADPRIGAPAERPAADPSVSPEERRRQERQREERLRRDPGAIPADPTYTG